MVRRCRRRHGLVRVRRPAGHRRVHLQGGREAGLTGAPSGQLLERGGAGRGRRAGRCGERVPRRRPEGVTTRVRYCRLPTAVYRESAAGTLHFVCEETHKTQDRRTAAEDANMDIITPWLVV